jgi:hypothetical protein
MQLKLSGTGAFLCGDSRTRPDILIGQDNTIWSFQETVNDTNAYASGSNHVAGPLLQIIYQPASN